MPALFAEDVRVTITSTPCTQVFSPISDFWPGFSTLTFARAGSRLGQRPLWDSATPRGSASDRMTRRGRLPVSLATSLSSPSASPARRQWCGSFAGCPASRLSLRPMRYRALAPLHHTRFRLCSLDHITFEAGEEGEHLVLFLGRYLCYATSDQRGLRNGLPLLRQEGEGLALLSHLEHQELERRSLAGVLIIVHLLGRYMARVTRLQGHRRLPCDL
jgi:hypothetical protein